MKTLEGSRHPGPFTWADIADAPDDGLRREIIGGSLILSPSPVGRHQLATTRLWQLLDGARPQQLTAVVAPFDWRYDETNVVQPDLVVCRSVEFDLDGILTSPAVPILLVEVTSSSNRDYDLSMKRGLYERLGVPNYWLVDPGPSDRAPSVTALALSDTGIYRVRAEAAGEETFATEVPFPVNFTPAQLLHR